MLTGKAHIATLLEKSQCKYKEVFMHFDLKFGKKTQELQCPDERILGVLLPKEPETLPNAHEEVMRALKNPIGSPPLRKIVNKGDTIAIITSDVTRPCPSHLLLPPLLEELEEAGIAKEDICIVFALGTHRKHTEEEIISLVGKDIYEQYTCIDSDMDNCVEVGISSNGTPFDIFKPVVDAHKRICLGNIEYHYFAGYSGGDKAIMPGVATTRSIQANHRMMIEPKACTGNIQDNPIRHDIEELEKFLSVDFLLNVILSPNKDIMKAVAGHHITAHREGCKFLDGLYKFPLQQPADIVVVSAGGFPKDINMYQAQKALDNARYAVKEGGVIILLASCNELYGSATFERWVKNATSPEQIIKDIHAHFELGGHKAAAIALTLQKAKVFCVSDMPDDVCKSLFFEPFATVQEALKAADAICGENASVLIMPNGGSTLPTI